MAELKKVTASGTGIVSWPEGDPRAEEKPEPPTATLGKVTASGTGTVTWPDKSPTKES